MSHFHPAFTTALWEDQRPPMSMADENRLTDTEKEIAVFVRGFAAGYATSFDGVPPKGAGKIHCIKLLRERYVKGLKLAKDLVDAYWPYGA